MLVDTWLIWSRDNIINMERAIFGTFTQSHLNGVSTSGVIARMN